MACHVVELEMNVGRAVATEPVIHGSSVGNFCPMDDTLSLSFLFIQICMLHLTA